MRVFVNRVRGGERISLAFHAALPTRPRLFARPHSAEASWAGLRAVEAWMALHFIYIAALAWLWRLGPGPRLATLAIAAAYLGVALLLARLEAGVAHRPGKPPHPLEVTRDWLPLAFTLLAYREMDLFTPAHRDYHLEKIWIAWDRALLGAGGMRAAVESLGSLLPAYLELCYLVVYAIGPFALGLLYFWRRRDLAPLVVFSYVFGTLVAYALFPLFPSEPPRTVFAGQDLPGVTTALRRLNLWVVGGYGIHSSVFPSAHVSSAFSAAFGMLAAYRERRALGLGMLVYAASVATATVYGRYHYAVDALAGLGVSLLALGATRVVAGHLAGADASTLLPHEEHHGSM